MAAKSSLSKRRSRAAFKRVKNVAAKIVGNPPLGQDVVHVILPAFGAYGATRFLQRLAFVQINKRWPKLGKHAPVIASAVALVVAYFAAHKVKRLEKYHGPILIGTAVAALQSAVQTYLPKYGWIVSDVRADQYKPLMQQAGIKLLQQAASTQALPSGDDDEYGYEDAPAAPMSAAEEGDPLPEAVDDEEELEGFGDLGSLGADDAEEAAWASN